MSTHEHTMIAHLRAEVSRLQAALDAATPKPKAKAVRKPKGSHWSDYSPTAWAACKAKHGPEPWLVANAAPWVELAASEASWTSPRGVKVKWNRAVRLPAAEFWPVGTFPKVVAVAVEPEPITSREESIRLIRAARERECRREMLRNYRAEDRARVAEGHGWRDVA